MLVLHSLVDIHGEPRNDAKGRDRFPVRQTMAKHSREAAEDCSDIAALAGEGEVVVLKQLGFVSGLKSTGAVEVLREREIRSLLVCGLSASSVVLRTALGAADERSVVTVIKRLCGSGGRIA